jgi:FkbM family methyltransferase
MAMKHYVCECLRPVIGLLPFGRARVLKPFGLRAQQDDSWLAHPRPRRVFFDRDIGAYVAVDLREWGGRWHYFTRRYYDQKNRLLVQMMLRPGDTYLDVGANLGMHTLAAARVVGPKGLVIAVEPNPAVFAHLQAHLAINGITCAHGENVGLSDTCGELVLSGASAHTGEFTFRTLDHPLCTVRVPVVVGDQLLAKYPPQGRVLVKIDTEGYEHHVLRGLRGLAARLDVAFSVEITDEWLRQTGSSAKQLFQEMHALGFESYQLAVRYKRLRPFPRLVACPEPLGCQFDALFVRPEEWTDFKLACR